MKDNIKTIEEILVKNKVLKTTDLNENFNLQITRDCYIGTVRWIANSMKEYAKQFIDLAAEKVFINIDNGYDDWEDLNNIIFEGRISINKESILKIKELIK